MKKKKRRSSDEIVLPPLPKGVTPEDIGRALIQQIKPVQPVVNRKRKRSSKDCVSAGRS